MGFTWQPTLSIPGHVIYHRLYLPGMTFIATHCDSVAAAQLAKHAKSKRTSYMLMPSSLHSEHMREDHRHNHNAIRVCTEELATVS